MDPLESVARYRKQQAPGPAGRTLTVAPPPAMPASSGATTTTLDPPAGAPPVPEGLDLLDVAASSDEAEPAGEGKVRGNARGRKQLLHVYLPGPTIDRLDGARPAHGTLGDAVMAALRGSYEWLVEHHTPEPVEAVGPFPAVRGPKRRQGLEQGRLKPFYVTPDEARGIDQLAEQLEMSASELVTLAVDHWFGQH